MGSWMVWVAGRGGRRYAVLRQGCGPVVALGTLVVVVQLLDKAADVPVAVPPRFRVLLGDVLGFEQGVYVFFVGVKGVDDVLAWVVGLFVLVKGVGDVLAGL